MRFPSDSSWRQPVHICRWSFVLRLALVFAFNLNSRNTPEVITGVLARSTDQQIFFFVDQILAVVLRHLEIRRELNGIGRASIFAKPAEDAAGEIDAEEFRVSAPAIILRRLQRDAVHWADSGAEITGHAALSSIRIARENNAPSCARRQIRLL